MLKTRYYLEGDESVLPRNIATKEAFMNAMALDIAMGGSTNTVLHILAIAHEANVDFTLEDIDQLSLKIPVLCKVSPNSHYHIQDVNRAGGIIGILGELEKAGLLDGSVKRVDGLTLKEAIDQFDVTRETADAEAFLIYKSAPGGYRNIELGSQDKMYQQLDLDRKNGCIRDADYAYSKDGGLAILKGNIARKGCIVKTAGVDSSILNFKGKARVFNSQDDTCRAILDDKIEPGDIIVIRYEGPKGGPGMQEMLYPTSYLKSKKLGKSCALITDGRFSGGTSGLSVGHISPEAAAKGEIGIIRDGDEISINIPERSINLLISDDEIQKRIAEEDAKGSEAWQPTGRDRKITKALKAYASMVTSADTGGVRQI